MCRGDLPLPLRISKYLQSDKICKIVFSATEVPPANPRFIIALVSAWSDASSPNI